MAALGFAPLNIPASEHPHFYGLPKFGPNYARTKVDNVYEIPPGVPSPSCFWVEGTNCDTTNQNKWAFPAVTAPGPVYMKAFYKEFNDSSFMYEKPTPPEWQHKGWSGPVLRATVGDTMEIHFMNKLKNVYDYDPTFKVNIFPVSETIKPTLTSYDVLFS